MIKVSKLTKNFKSGDLTVRAVDEVSFTVPTGKFVSIIGRSGSGKSTLLSLLGALDKPSSGNIDIEGTDITKLSDHELIKYRGQAIGFIFQGYNLVPNLSALENVMLPMEYAKIPKNERKERAKHLLEQVGLSIEKHSRKPGRLSGGEQQRVAIARALSNKPKLILADEPTGNLDHQTGKMIFDLLHNLSSTEKTTVIVVTHDLEIAGKTSQTFKLVDGKMEKK